MASAPVVGIRPYAPSSGVGPGPAFLPALGAAALSSASTLSSAGLVSLAGSADLTSLSTLATAGQVDQFGSAAIDSTSTLSASGMVALSGGSALSSVSTISASGQIPVSGGAGLSSTSTLTVAGRVALSGSAALASLSTLAATGLAMQSGSASLASISTLAATGQVFNLALGSADLSSTSTLVVAGLTPLMGSANLSGRSTLLIEDARIGARDADVIDAVIAALRATGSFDGVFWGEPDRSRGRPADLAALAWVEPETWAELDEFDDAADYQSVVRSTFTLTIAVRNPEPRARDRRVDLLMDVAKNAIDEQSLAGLTIPGLTILRRGKYQPALNPERRMTVVGEYAYFVDGAPNHPTDP